MDRKCVLKENSCCRGLEEKKGLDGQRRKAENVSGKKMIINMTFSESLQINKVPVNGN